MLTRKTAFPRGVLHIGPGEPILGHELFEPSEPLRFFVEHYWAVTCERQPPRARETVPHPCVHLVLEPGRSELLGIHRQRFTRIIDGSGRVLGTKFRPGGFRAFVRQSVARLTGKIVHPAEFSGPAIHDLEATATSCLEAGEGFEHVDRFAAGQVPSDSCSRP